MSNEKHDLQHQADRAKPGSKRSVLSYLVVLFGVAFVLLLLSYFMQQRISEAAMDNLQQTSTSAVQTLENIIQERDNLKEQVLQLQQDVERLTEEKTELDSARRLQNNALNELLDQADAMQWFWQIEHAFTSGDRAKTEALIEQFESLELFDCLPAENTTETDQISPAQRYKDICDILFLT